MENKINNYILGSIDSPSDPRDYTFDDLCLATENNNLPEEFCLDWNAYEILDQKDIGSCKAHSLSMIKTYIDGNDFNNRYSVGWIYGNRYDSDWQGHGLISRETLKHLVNEGVVLHNDFPINEEYPNIVKTIDKYGRDKLLTRANKHKSLAYIRLSKDNIKSYLVNYKKPVLIDVSVYENFYQANNNKGVIPAIPTGKKLGGHSMIVIGYKNDMLIIVNSWGERNGDKGIYYLDINSVIIKELWALEDILNVNRPKKLVNCGWEKYLTPAGTQWKYKKADGSYASNEWLQIGQDWFRFNEHSIALCNEWFKDSDGNWYYLDENCYMKTGWLLWKGNYYYLYPQVGKPKGSMATNTIIENKYYVDENGVWDCITL